MEIGLGRCFVERVICLGNPFFSIYGNNKKVENHSFGLNLEMHDL